MGAKPRIARAWIADPKVHTGHTNDNVHAEGDRESGGYRRSFCKKFVFSLLILARISTKTHQKCKKPPNIHQNCRKYSNFITLIFFIKIVFHLDFQLCLGIPHILQKSDVKINLASKGSDDTK